MSIRLVADTPYRSSMPSVRRAGYLTIISFAASAFQVSVQPDCGPAVFGVILALLVLVFGTVFLIVQEEIRRSEMAKLQAPDPIKRKH
ncbi:hypothetical protein JCM24511_01220 [Saitozyma sp. JCM 24511]|nr:hypothetical protein JCM24511_01220 [Saitozyma sp. JCM 24511]